ncbi:MAG: hypothetical protein ACRD2C_17865 [Acidimicrobiales bacterium]
MSTALMDPKPATARRLRSLLGSPVTVRTVSRTLRGVLLSSVRGSVWLVVEDADVIVPVGEIVSVDA